MSERKNSHGSEISKKAPDEGDRGIPPIKNQPLDNKKVLEEKKKIPPEEKKNWYGEKYCGLCKDYPKRKYFRVFTRRTNVGNTIFHYKIYGGRKGAERASLDFFRKKSLKHGEIKSGNMCYVESNGGQWTIKKHIFHGINNVLRFDSKFEDEMSDCRVIPRLGRHRYDIRVERVLEGASGPSLYSLFFPDEYSKGLKLFFRNGNPFDYRRSNLRFLSVEKLYKKFKKVFSRNLEDKKGEGATPLCPKEAKGSIPELTLFESAKEFLSHKIIRKNGLAYVRYKCASECDRKFSESDGSISLYLEMVSRSLKRVVNRYYHYKKRDYVLIFVDDYDKEGDDKDEEVKGAILKGSVSKETSKTTVVPLRGLRGSRRVPIVLKVDKKDMYLFAYNDIMVSFGKSGPENIKIGSHGKYVSFLEYFYPFRKAEFIRGISSVLIEAPDGSKESSEGLGKVHMVDLRSSNLKVSSPIIPLDLFARKVVKEKGGELIKFEAIILLDGRSKSRDRTPKVLGDSEDTSHTSNTQEIVRKFMKIINDERHGIFGSEKDGDLKEKQGVISRKKKYMEEEGVWHGGKLKNSEIKFVIEEHEISVLVNKELDGVAKWRKACNIILPRLSGRYSSELENAVRTIYKKRDLFIQKFNEEFPDKKIKYYNRIRRVFDGKGNKFIQVKLHKGSQAHSKHMYGTHFEEIFVMECEIKFLHVIRSGIWRIGKDKISNVKGWDCPEYEYYAYCLGGKKRYFNVEAYPNKKRRVKVYKRKERIV